MRDTEIVAIVAYVSQLNPAQKVDEYTADAWADVLRDVPADMGTAKLAVVRIARRQQWISPGEVRKEIRSMLRPVDLERPADARALPSRFESDEDRSERIRRGVAAVRAELDRIAAEREGAE